MQSFTLGDNPIQRRVSHAHRNIIIICCRGLSGVVWGLVESRRVGYSEADLLTSYPNISATNLANVWAYAAAFPDEIEAEIKENSDLFYPEISGAVTLIP